MKKLIVTDEDELNVIEEALLSYDPYEDETYTLGENNERYETLKQLLKRFGH